MNKFILNEMMMRSTFY